MSYFCMWAQSRWLLLQALSFQSYHFCFLHVFDSLLYRQLQPFIQPLLDRKCKALQRRTIVLQSVFQNILACSCIQFCFSWNDSIISLLIAQQMEEYIAYLFHTAWMPGLNTNTAYLQIFFHSGGPLKMMKDIFCSSVDGSSLYIKIS